MQPRRGGDAERIAQRLFATSSVNQAGQASMSVLRATPFVFLKGDQTPLHTPEGDRVHVVSRGTMSRLPDAVATVLFWLSSTSPSAKATRRPVLVTVPVQVSGPLPELIGRRKFTLISMEV